jgi:exodeoxyribonuclease V alpha subunit
MNEVEISVKITKVFAQKNSWFSSVVEDKNGSTIKLTGFNNSELTDIKNRYINAIGTIENSDKYGPSFKSSKISFIIDEVFYNFLNDHIKYISKKRVEKYLAFYGEDTILSWFEDKNRSMLELLKSNKNRKVDKIIDSWIENGETYHFFKLFKDENKNIDLLTSNQITKIYKYYKDLGISIKGAVEIIINQPYILLDIEGFGFKLVDSIALILGIDKYDDIRIQEFIKYRMRQLSENEGNTLFTTKKLLNDLRKNILDLDIPYKEYIFLSMLKANIELGSIVKLGEYITLKTYFDYEKYIYNDLIERSKKETTSITQYIDNSIKQAERNLSIILSNHQKDFIKQVNNRSISILRGYAGTGKSFTSKIALDLFVDNLYCSKEDIVVCALSAVAARKIGEYTNYNYKTIHSLLFDKNVRDYNNMLTYKVILVDEMSMVNSEIFYKLLKIINRDTVIILVGDNAQLPPIGPGEPFEDIINADILPTVELTEVKRSKNQSINLIAQTIRDNNIPKLDNSDNLHYYDITDINDEQVLSNAISLYNREYAKTTNDYFLQGDYKSYIDDTQFIIPKKASILGTRHINQLLAEKFNKFNISRTFSIKHYKDTITYKIGDKVIHLLNEDMSVLDTTNLKIDITQNNILSNIIEGATFTKSKVYNGSIGIVCYVSLDSNSIYVYYPYDKQIVHYSTKDIKDKMVDLAYAITVHKAQGSGYNNIFYIQKGSYPNAFYNRKMLYTAITRTIDKCHLYISNEDMKQTILNGLNMKRDTVMKLLNKKEVNG